MTKCIQELQTEHELVYIYNYRIKLKKEVKSLSSYEE